MLSPRCQYSPDPVIRLLPAQREVRDRILRDLHFGALPLEPGPCLCGAGDGSVLAERDRWGLPVRTVLCEHCGIVRTDPRLSEAALPLFYSRDYRRLMDGDPEPSASAFQLQLRRGREAMAFVEGHLELRAATRIHEIGCSAGGVLWPFHEKGCVTVGVDYDSHFVESGRRRGLDLRVGGLDELRAQPKADLLILSHVIEHQNSPANFLGNCLSLVRPGGRIFVAVPGLDHIREDYCGNWLLYLQICHTYHFTRRTLSSLLAANGVVIEKSDDSVRVLGRWGETPHPAPPTERENPSRVRTALSGLETDWAAQQPHRRFRRRVVRVLDALRGR